MVWPWTLTFWPQNVIRSSVSQDAPVTKVWRKSVNRYWRYCGNIKLPRESRTHGRRHGRTTRKHIASAGAYRRRRLKKLLIVYLTVWLVWGRESGLSQSMKNMSTIDWPIRRWITSQNLNKSAITRYMTYTELCGSTIISTVLWPCVPKPQNHYNITKTADSSKAELLYINNMYISIKSQSKYNSLKYKTKNSTVRDWRLTPPVSQGRPSSKSRDTKTRTDIKNKKSGPNKFRYCPVVKE